MPSTGSVTHWLALLREGDAQAAQRLWERYFDQLVRLARSRLGGVSRLAADEEDVALSAFADLCAALQRDRYPQLTDRHGLWRLLVTIAARKAANLARRQRPAPVPASEEELEAAIGREPSPEFAAQAAEEYHRLLDLLPDEAYRKVAVAKLEECTNPEIAGRLNCSLTSIERKLRLIRRIWQENDEG